MTVPRPDTHRVFAVVVTGLLFATLVACGGDSQSVPPPSGTSTTSAPESTSGSTGDATGRTTSGSASSSRGGRESRGTSTTTGSAGAVPQDGQGTSARTGTTAEDRRATTVSGAPGIAGQRRTGPTTTAKRITPAPGSSSQPSTRTRTTNPPVIEPPLPEPASGFAWVPFGPADPDDPSDFRNYLFLEDRDCAGLTGAGQTEEGAAGQLWRALGAVCRASFEGDSAAWQEAAVAAEESRSRSVDDASTCLYDAARRLLDDSLTWHAANPEEAPAVTTPGGGTAVACPLRIDLAQTVTPAGVLSDQLSGPLSGETHLILWGQSTSADNTVVRIGEMELASLDETECPYPGPLSSTDRFACVQVPAAEFSGPVSVTLTNRGGSITLDEPYIYLDASGPSPSSATGDD